MMELDETALVADSHLEQNLRRLQEEERLLLEQQAAMDAGAVDDIAALEHQDALRLNQLQQQELHKQQQAAVQRLAMRHGHAHDGLGAGAAAAGRREPRRRALCTVRVNNLHAAEAIETDV